MTKQIRQCSECKTIYLTDGGCDEEPVLGGELVALTLAYGPLKEACCFGCLDSIISDLTHGNMIHWNYAGEKDEL
jgi:hypothetical protein